MEALVAPDRSVVFLESELMKDNLITLKSVSSEMEAEILSGKLNAYGIESFIQKDDCGGADPMMHDFFGVHIKVNRSEAEEALKIINQGHNNGRKIKERVASKSLMPFWVLMFLSVGTGLFLSGHAYYPRLTIFGVAFIIVGVALWLSLKLKKRTQHSPPADR